MTDTYTRRQLNSLIRSVHGTHGHEIEERGIIYDAARMEPGEQVACCTSLLPMGDGTLLASFQVGPKKHGPASHVRLCRSTDGGVKWESLGAKFDHVWQGLPGSLSIGEMVTQHGFSSRRITSTSIGQMIERLATKLTSAGAPVDRKGLRRALN